MGAGVKVSVCGESKARVPRVRGETVSSILPGYISEVKSKASGPVYNIHSGRQGTNGNKRQAYSPGPAKHIAKKRNVNLPYTHHPQLTTFHKNPVSSQVSHSPPHPSCSKILDPVAFPVSTPMIRTYFA